MHDKRIVFMGTPEFAAHCLSQLLAEKFNIVGVVTVADKPAGRGQQLQESAVKKVALQHNLPLLQPLKLKDESFLDALKKWDADLFVVIAFRMLPEAVWKMPPYGSINLHGSLLPQFRGAAPINHAIISGEKVSGVTTFFIEQEIDMGNILLQKSVDIGENETAGELHDKLMHVGADLVCETLHGVFNGTLHATPQANFEVGQLKHATKIFKSDCEIKWNQQAQQVHDFIRGLSPYPAAWTTIYTPEPKSAKIFATRKSIKSIGQMAGELTIEDGKIYVQCQDTALQILELQLEGKKRVSAEEFVRGLRNPITIFN